MRQVLLRLKAGSSRHQRRPSAPNPLTRVYVSYTLWKIEQGAACTFLSEVGQGSLHGIAATTACPT